MFDLAVGEAVSKVTDDTDGELDGRLRPLAIGKGLLYELENGRHMSLKQVHLRSVLKSDDDTAVCFQDTLTKLLNVLNELDIQLTASVQSRHFDIKA